MEKTLREIAALVDGNIIGDGDLIIRGVKDIKHALPEDLTFAVEPHLEAAERCGAGAVIVPETVKFYQKPAICVSNPRAAFIKLLEIYTPPLKVRRGVHPTAVIGEHAVIGKDVSVMPYAVIEDHAVVGDRSIVYPFVYIGQNTKIGGDCLLYPNVTIRENCVVGDRAIIHSGAVIGSDGFGFVTEGGKHTKMPQIGNVIIEDDVEIGANVGIDRATMDSTVIKRGTKVDNLVHLGHNVTVGEDGLIVAQTGIAGSTTIGDHCTFAGQCGCVGHIEIGDHCTFAARSAPIGDVPAGSFYGGFPARPHRDWLRVQAGMQKTPELVRKMREMEKRLAELEKKLKG